MTRTRIKICGITRHEDLETAVAFGADAIGLVAYPASPRYVGPELAASLAGAMPPFVTPVTLFVNPTRDEVGAYLDLYPGYLLQFHGDESAEECEQFGNPYVKAARMTQDVDLDAFAAAHPHAQGILVDAWSEGYGGAGKTFDWSWLPRRFDRPLILSGGLTPENVSDAIARVRPWAVDVSSGVERSKGLKDAGKLSAFITAVHAADRARTDSAVT